MKTSTGLVILSSLVLFFHWSCQKEISGEISGNINKPHSVTVYLTDHDTPVFDSVFIDFQKLEVKLEDDTLSNGGWVTLSITPGVYNILRFRNGLDTLFATGTVPNARIRKIRLTLGMQNTAFTNGQGFPLRIDDNDRQVVVDLGNSNFEIVPPNQVLFWIDFDAGRSIQVDNSGPGNNNGYRLKCHIKVFTRQNTGSIEGRVFPPAANPIVTAFNGTDTATAIPDPNDGEFKIVGLTPGIYTVLYDGQNNYNDTTITNVMVRSRENTHLPAITLHQ